MVRNNRSRLSSADVQVEIAATGGQHERTGDARGHPGRSIFRPRASKQSTALSKVPAGPAAGRRRRLAAYAGSDSAVARSSDTNLPPLHASIRAMTLSEPH